MTKEIPRKVRTHFLEMALDPIKAMIGNGLIGENEALSLVAQTTHSGQYEDSSEEFKKFIKCSKIIFRDQPNFEASYASSGDGYTYQPSAINDVNLLFKLHQHLGGKSYDSPLELKNEMQRLLAGKEILELGAGAGFCVKNLTDLGAKVIGIEDRTNYRGKIPNIDMRYGNALDLDRLCQRENFDIVLSNDFFAAACVRPSDAKRIVELSGDKTKDNGLHLHLMKYFKMNPAVAELRAWILDKKEGSRKWEDMLAYMNETEYDAMLWTNQSTLDPQYLIRGGMRILEYNLDNRDLVIAARKQGAR